MNKIKKYFKLVGAVVFIIIILFIIGVFNPTITLESDITDSEFILYNQSKKTEVTFKTPFKKKLKPGVYYLKALNTKKYTDSEQSITVDKSATIKLAFDVNYDYFKKDQEVIKNILLEKYPKTIKDNLYTIMPGKFFKNGDYYATSIGFFLNDEDGTSGLFGNIYKVIFQRSGDSWKQLTHPSLIISSAEYNNIPLEIIQEVNLWNE